jgi:hypothetical protein
MSSSSTAEPRRRSWFRHPSTRQIWWVSFGVFAVLGALWAVSSPLMSAPDEDAHTVKAVALATGQLTGRNEWVTNDPRGIPDQLDTHFMIPRAFAGLGSLQACHAFSPTTAAGCAPTVPTATADTDVASYTGTYPPLYYAMVGWPSRLLSPYRSLYAMRLVGVVIGSALLASALVSLQRVAPGGLGMAALALSTTPMVFFLMGSINPNGLEIAATIAAWSSMLDLLNRSGPVPGRLITRVLIASTCLVAARPLGPALAFLVLGLVLLAAATRARIIELVRDHRVRVGAVATAGALVASVGWIVWSGVGNTFTGSPRPDLTFGPALTEAVHLEPWRTHQLYGVFGWLDTPTPSAMVWTWLVAIAVLAIAALVAGSWRQRAALVACLTASVVVPLLAEAWKAHQGGMYWQGRYTLPFVVGAPILSGWILASGHHPPRRVTRAVSTGVIAAAALGQLIAHGVALTRYVVAAPGANPLTYLKGSGWKPPLGVTALFAIALLASGSYALWLITIACADAPQDVSPRVGAVRRRPEPDRVPGF